MPECRYGTLPDTAHRLRFNGPARAGRSPFAARPRPCELIQNFKTSKPQSTIGKVFALPIGQASQLGSREFAATESEWPWLDPRRS